MVPSSPAECDSTRAQNWWRTAMWSWIRPCGVVVWASSASPRRTSSGPTCATAATVRGPPSGVCTPHPHPPLTCSPSLHRHHPRGLRGPEAAAGLGMGLGTRHWMTATLAAALPMGGHRHQAPGGSRPWGEGEGLRDNKIKCVCVAEGLAVVPASGRW